MRLKQNRVIMQLVTPEIIKKMSIRCILKKGYSIKRMPLLIRKSLKNK